MGLIVPLSFEKEKHMLLRILLFGFIVMRDLAGLFAFL